jgi:xylulose-5-phosphate/fructose-6-phosphate phosphoketolase
MSTATTKRREKTAAALSAAELQQDRRALARLELPLVGQIYLLDNPLLRKPLAREHIKPRLLGHWGTSPGLNFLYAHLNRVINKNDLDMIYVIGPGHGGTFAGRARVSRRAPTARSTRTSSRTRTG